MGNAIASYCCGRTGIPLILIQALVLCIAGQFAAAGPAGEYESPHQLAAADLLPVYLLEGDVFAVAPEVWNDGETNHYRVNASQGVFEAAGRDELERIMQELRAIAYLQAHRKRTGSAMGFNQGVKKVVTAPYHSVKRVVFDPLYAIEAVPTEIVDYASRFATVSDLFKYGPRVFIRRSLGIDGARDLLADRLHVDEDTDNAVLRDEIRRVGWGVWLGGLVPDIGEGYIDLELDLATEVGDWGEGNLGRAVRAVRREVFPRHARFLLRKRDLPEPLIDAFRAHPYYDGDLREDLAEALVILEGTAGLDAYLAWAMTVDNEIEARRTMAITRVVATYHLEEGSIAEVRNQGDVVVLHTTSGTAIALLIHDYLIWTPAAAETLRTAESLAGTAPLEVWSLGAFSPRMQSELTQRGHRARPEVAKDFPKFQRPRKGLKRLERAYEERVEDPIQTELDERFLPERNRRLYLAPPGPGTGPVVLRSAAVSGQSAPIDPGVAPPTTPPERMHLRHGRKPTGPAHGTGNAIIRDRLQRR